MSLAVEGSIEFDNSFVRDLEGMYETWSPQPAPAPALVVLNESLAIDLGFDPEALRTPAGVDLLAGGITPPGASPVAQAYSGHQFGGYSPRLGDGRAFLLGEVCDHGGTRRDLHLKGTGRTPFARGGDGKAVLGPMLREYVMCEAMHALHVPTTRGLAVVTTGEHVARQALLPGAVFTRVASSHLRVGTFQYAAASGDPTLLGRVADHAIARHHPDVAGSESPYLAFFERVLDAQASLVARWMLVGFVHGVMNTDNTTISGETIDYGPCAFIDAYDPATVFSSIDHGGRYAYGNQPQIAQWNLARLAETLLPLIDPTPETAIAAATEVLSTFATRYERHRSHGMRRKLGLEGGRADDGTADELADELLALMQAQAVDYTSCFRALAALARGEGDPARALFADPDAFDAWSRGWLDVVTSDARPAHAIADSMDAVNPVYIPRNHLVEEALTAATTGDVTPFERLVDVLRRPFDERPGLERYAAPAPPGTGRHRTFCGT